ncbi:MAG: 50S ribosomal protein L25/general stress protein Ctc [Bacteroidetes bacterium]|jgi:large subunit ribosomal protein L25|nr:50S ribosomal protein L25/general stress protein Ctc [Bacteroidota bacterium]
MKTIFLKGELRDEVGTRTAKALRAEGKVPCNMYGLADGNLNFAVYHADFKNLVYTPNVYKVKIELGGKNYDAILQDIQFHPVSDMIIHCDFVAVDAAKPVIMEIPVRVVGNSPGVRAGGKLVKKLNRLRVRGLIQNLPDFIDVSIDTLEIGQSAKVGHVEVSGFELLDSPANAILSIKTTRALMQAAADAAKK